MTVQYGKVQTHQCDFTGLPPAGTQRFSSQAQTFSVGLGRKLTVSSNFLLSSAVKEPRVKIPPPVDGANSALATCSARLPACPRGVASAEDVTEQNKDATLVMQPSLFGGQCGGMNY